MFVYSAAIFVGAFLLFLVQPVIAKMILPWFGGTAAVWTTCLAFFQTLLLFGYLYSHETTRRLPARLQVAVHSALLALSLLLLPFAPNPGWKPVGNEDPSLRILVLLAASIGLPYFLLATTSPLVQVWYTRGHQAGLPYRLFALSNLASLIALLAYPVLIEPWTSSRSQALAWSAVYVVYAGMTIVAGIRTLRNPNPVPVAAESVIASPRQSAEWFLLAACASVLLLSVTSHLTQNVASIPFLWVLPLGLYLLSFVLCFDRDGWYRRNVFLWLVSAALLAMGFGQLIFEPAYTLEVTIPVFLTGLFLCCMFCHGELVLRRPPTSQLTSFYLMIALGGAAGSLFTGFVAPRLFVTYLELPIGIVLCSLLTTYFLWQRRSRKNLVLVYVLIAVVFTGVMYERLLAADVRIARRSFFGGLRIMDRAGTRLLLHGAVSHGAQLLKPQLRREPTTYYGRRSGVGLAFADLPGRPRRVGIIGLGAGTLAAYAREGDVFRFYEINPQVVELATREFTFLNDSAAHIEVVLGDGRLSMERERPENYDLLVVDAFSGDSIPAHLLSREAIAVYFRHLKPDGVLAVHISNASLDLWPVVYASARAQNKVPMLVFSPVDERVAVSEAAWAVVANDTEPFTRPAMAKAAFLPETRKIRAWTDDYSNVVQLLK